MSLPYKENLISENEKIRIFPENCSQKDLEWHRDKKDRHVKILKCKNWQLQLDNNLPFILVENEEYFIPKHYFHRLIKGEGDLIIKIKE